MNSVQSQNPQKYYSLNQYADVRKIDMHLHLNTGETTLIDLAKEDKFKILSINVDYPAFPPVDEQQQITEKLSGLHPNRVGFVGTFLMDGWDENGWEEKVIAQIDDVIERGAVGIKVWKNIGMDFRDESGELVFIDDPKFDPVFDHIRDLNIPLIGHLGEPKDCWLSLDNMIVDYNRDYFREHPEYHMYKHPELPSYEDQISARDRMLEKHSDLTFIGAHFGSLEWSVEEMAKFLDRFPRAMLDSAARMGAIQYQTAQERNQVRKFFIKYQDRLMYATDFFQESGEDQNQFRQDAHAKWLSDWQFLVTDDSMKVGDIKESFHGLHLPVSIVDKIYRGNALRVFPGAWE